MSDVLADYFNALKRLVDGCPSVVPKGTKITNDSVSLEAGRKKGTIKKSRPIFRELIIAIETEASSRLNPKKKQIEALSMAKSEVAKYRSLWEEALSREISLVQQLRMERREWAAEKAALTGENISLLLAKKPQLSATDRSRS